VRSASPPAVLLGHFPTPAVSPCPICRTPAERRLAALVAGEILTVDLCIGCATLADERPILQVADGPRGTVGVPSLDAPSTVRLLYGRSPRSC